MPPLPYIFYDEFDADYDSDDSLDLCVAKAKAPISLNSMEYSLRQFAKRMGQLNFRTFNMWQKGLAAGLLKKKHPSIIPGHNLVKQRQDRPLHWERAVADIVETSETWLPLEDFDHTE